MKINAYLMMSMLAISLVSCKKNNEEPQAQDYMTWKIDGAMYSADTSIFQPEAVYYTNPSPVSLGISAYTHTLSIHINLLDESSYLGTFNFGDKDSNNNIHYAVLSYGTDGKPADYNQDSWFANGVNSSGGTITITEYDMANHRITGTFQGAFINFTDGSSKMVTDGAFSLPLSTDND